MNITIFEKPTFFVEEQNRFTYPKKIEFDVDLDWSEICSIFENVDQEVEHKTAAQGYTMCKYSDPSGGRGKANILSYSAIVLDYDDGDTIADVLQKIANYKHILYTSYNHLADGKTEKFRVIIPLTEEVDHSVYERLDLNKLIENFGKIDKSTTAPARFFYLPSYHPKRKNLNRVIVKTEGKSFDIKDYLKPHIERKKVEREPNYKPDEKLLELCAELPFDSVRNNDFVKLMWAVTETFGEMEAQELGEALRPDYPTSKIREIVRRNDGSMTAGTIIWFLKRDGIIKQNHRREQLERAMDEYRTEVK